MSVDVLKERLKTWWNAESLLVRLCMLYSFGEYTHKIIGQQPDNITKVDATADG